MSDNRSSYEVAYDFRLQGRSILMIGKLLTPVMILGMACDDVEESRREDRVLSRPEQLLMLKRKMNWNLLECFCWKLSRWY